MMAEDKRHTKMGDAGLESCHAAHHEVIVGLMRQRDEWKAEAQKQMGFVGKAMAELVKAQEHVAELKKGILYWSEKTVAADDYAEFLLSEHDGRLAERDFLKGVSDGKGLVIDMLFKQRDESRHAIKVMQARINQLVKEREKARQ